MNIPPHFLLAQTWATQIRARQFRFAIPEELHPDTAMLIGADFLVFLALLADDLGGLNAVNARLRE